MMLYLLYFGLTTLAAPIVAAYLFSKPRYRPLLGRFRPNVPYMGSAPIWVHACSVGEVNTARPLLLALQKRWPGIPLVLTTSTLSGMELSSTVGHGVQRTWFPFDHPLVVGRFVHDLNPRILVLIETELWPAVLTEAYRHQTPAVLINGRISDKHFERYKRARPLLRSFLRRLAAVGAQHDEYAGRFGELGVPPDAIYVTGNTKFDGVQTEIDVKGVRRLRKESGFKPKDPVLIFGSTRPGDEELAALCWKELREEFPKLRLVVAPRHVNRLQDAMAPFDEGVLQRSRLLEGAEPDGERVLFLDTVGELSAFYGMAAIAVIGGSFFPGVDGHNPLESAALGVPTVFGPYMRNFVGPSETLVKHGGARQTSSADDLLPTLRELLQDKEKRLALAQRGRDAVVQNQGALERSVDLIGAFLDHSQR